MNTTLYCRLQNKLGALDRLLGALTIRGIVPERFNVMPDKTEDCLQLTMTFDCENEKCLEKLIKAFYRQVYVLEVRWVLADANEEEAFPLLSAVPSQAPERASVRMPSESRFPVSSTASLERRTSLASHR